MIVVLCLVKYTFVILIFTFCHSSCFLWNI